MNYKRLIFSISILVFVSCNEITKDDLKGKWIASAGYGEPQFWEINFMDDKVELITDDSFKEVGNCRIENGDLEIELGRDSLIIVTKIQSLEVDTLKLFDSLVYHRNLNFYTPDFESYKLIDIATDKFVSSKKELYGVIHFYKSFDNEIRIRCGGKMIGYHEVPLCLSRGHSSFDLLVYIGKGITLQDLKYIYYQLFLVGKEQVWLGTKREGISDTHIFEDEIDIWYRELEEHLKNSKIPQPPPPPPNKKFLSKKDFQRQGGVEVQIIEKKDFKKINDSINVGKYVISISSDLSIDDYIQLKMILFEKQKINSEIITEISLD